MYIYCSIEFAQRSFGGVDCRYLAPVSKSGKPKGRGEQYPIRATPYPLTPTLTPNPLSTCMTRDFDETEFFAS